LINKVLEEYFTGPLNGEATCFAVHTELQDGLISLLVFRFLSEREVNEEAKGIGGVGRAGQGQGQEW
jgi:hypothetical protein